MSTQPDKTTLFDAEELRRRKSMMLFHPNESVGGSNTDLATKLRAAKTMQMDPTELHYLLEQAALALERA